MVAVYLLSTLSTYGTSRILVRVAQRVSHDLRAELFDRMQALPMAVFHSHTHGQLMSTYTNDIDTISNFISSSPGQRHYQLCWASWGSWQCCW